MQTWDLDTPGGNDASGPQVLVSTPEARVILIELGAQEELGEHRVRERAILQVLAGSIELGVEGAVQVCPAETLVVFEPGEPHSVRALEQSRLLLTLAPWPGVGHYGAEEDANPHDLPINATRPAS